MRIRPESFAFTLLLSALGGLTSLSIDMGLPALVIIGHGLHVSPSLVGLTLGVFLTGLALGPLVLGPISDKLGRRPVLLGGCVLFTVAGAGCAVAHSFPALLIWRFLAGAGAGVGSALSLAMVRDLFDGAVARVRLSYVSTVGTLAPMIAPALGGLVLVEAGWRAIYGLLAGVGAVLLVIVVVGLEETLDQPDSHALEMRQLLANYGHFLGNRLCLGYSLVGSLIFGCMFSYVSSSPLVMMGLLGVSPGRYGWTFAATALGIMAGAFVNGRLNKRGVPAATLLIVGLVALTLINFILVASVFCGWTCLGLILPLLVANAAAFGMIGPNATQGALHPMPDMAGIAAAIFGSARMLTGALASALTAYLVAAFHESASGKVMAVSMVLFSIAALTAYLGLVRPAERRERFASRREVEILAAAKGPI